MTLDEAIRIKEEGQHWLPKESYPELLEADTLSIAALIFSKNVLKLLPVVFELPVPGETGE